MATHADDNKENIDFVDTTDAETAGPSNLWSCSQLRGEICILQQKLALSLFWLSTIQNDNQKILDFRIIVRWKPAMILGPTVHCLNYWGSRKDGNTERKSSTGRSRSLPRMEEFFLILVCLRLGLFEIRAEGSGRPIWYLSFYRLSYLYNLD